MDKKVQLTDFVLHFTILQMLFYKNKCPQYRLSMRKKDNVSSIKTPHMAIIEFLFNNFQLMSPFSKMEKSTY